MIFELKYFSDVGAHFTRFSGIQMPIPPGTHVDRIEIGFQTATIPAILFHAQTTDSSQRSLILGIDSNGILYLQSQKLDYEEFLLKNDQINLTIGEYYSVDIVKKSQLLIEMRTNSFLPAQFKSNSALASWSDFNYVWIGQSSPWKCMSQENFSERAR